MRGRYYFNKDEVSKSEYIKQRTLQVKEMGFDQILIESVERAAGDDYEGEFTPMGREDHIIFTTELLRRMWHGGLLEHPRKTKKRLIAWSSRME